MKFVKVKKRHRPIVRKMLKDMSDYMTSNWKRKPMKIDADQNAYLVIINGEIVATFSLRKRTDCDMTVFYRFFLIEKYRGTYLAKQIMRAAEKLASKDYLIVLEVYKENKRAIRLYESLGYSKYSENDMFDYMYKDLEEEVNDK